MFATHTLQTSGYNIPTMSKVVGKKLRQAREEKGVSLEQAAATTHIRLRFLASMEAGNFGDLPSQLQIKGFLRSYGGYLGLDAEALIAAVDLDPWQALEVLKDDAPPKSVSDKEAAMDSAASFAAIGEMLSSQREVLGLTLADVEQHTHLRLRYLNALESGEFDELPSPVQGRGMLKNYAAFIGLDADQLLLKYADGLQAKLVEGQSERPPQQPSPHRKRSALKKERRFANREMLVGSFIVFFIIAFIIWGISLIQGTIADQNEIVPTPPSIGDVLLPSVTPAQLPTVTPTIPVPIEGLESENGDTVDEENTVEEPDAQETQIIVVSENIEGAVQLQIIIRQRAWMRVQVDGKTEFEGRVIPNSAYAFAGEEYIEITTGNAAGLQVIYNELDLGTLGSYGEVITFVITSSGVQTPTPTITLTPTVTETVEPTVTPTP
jgi:cytoskeletal protein RodZ